MTEGEILVAEGGLSGAMDTLHFLSKSLRIDGPVINENTSPFAGIEMTIGDSESEFDSSLLPLNDLSRWGVITPGEASSDGAFLINISEMGALTGSQITALVTDAGAGVRHAGRILADRNDFSITTEGAILIDGGETVVAGDIALTGRELFMRGALLPASSTLGTAQPENIPREPDVDTSLNIGLNVNNSPPEDDGDISRDPLLPGGAEPPDLEENLEDPRATLNSVASSVTIAVTEGPVTLEAALISAAGEITITTPQSFSANAVEVFSGDRINVSATDITLTSAPELGGVKVGDAARTFLAANAPLTLEATQGNIIIDGARVQGARDLDEDAETELAVNLMSPLDILITTIDVDNLGVVFGVDGDVKLEARRHILNHTSRIIANGDIFISAGGDFDNIIDIPNGEREPFANLTSSSRFLGRNSERHLILDYGELDVLDQLAFVTATGSVEITATEDISNIGGQINANDGNIVLTGRNVYSEGLVTGQFEYERKCFIFCRSSGTSTLDVTGGQISAGTELIINSENRISNRGGFLTGLEGITFNGRNIVFEALFLPQIVDRPGGLYNFWSGHSAWIYWRDVLGGAFSGGADFVINDADTILLRGVEIEKLITDTEVVIEYRPRQIGRADDQTIGYFSDLEPVIGK